MEIIVPSIDEMALIGERLGSDLINQRALESLLSKVRAECRHMERDIKGQIAKASAIIWTEIVRKQPFLGENRATATELMLYFLEKNNFSLELTEAETKKSFIWPRGEATYDELVRWIYERMKEQIN